MRRSRQRLRTGALLREYRGVYRVGHRAPSLEARYLAAVWACGDQALLSGRSAAYLLGLLKGSAPPPEVTARTARRVPGVKTRRITSPEDATTWRGIPVTTVARTLVDLAAVLTADDLARACHEAGVRHRTTPAMVEAVLARRPRTPGAQKLRASCTETSASRSAGSSRGSSSSCARPGSTLPETNRPAGGRRVDCRWPDQRLTVELDSYRYHRSRHAWSRTAAVSARPAPAATSSAATRTATSSSSRSSCSPSCAFCSPAADRPQLVGARPGREQQPADRARDGQQHARPRLPRPPRRCRGSAPRPRRRRSGRPAAGRASPGRSARRSRRRTTRRRRPRAAVIQLRKICANTATSTKPTTRLPPRSLRSTARPFHSSRPSAGGEVPQARAERPDHREADSGSHHGRPSGADERERRQRGQRRLDGQDRKLRGDQRRHLRADLRGRAPQRGDPRGDPEVPVDHAAQDLHARRAIEDAARDRPAGRLDGQVPRLAAREQRDDLQQHGRRRAPTARRWRARPRTRRGAPRARTRGPPR